MNIGIAPRILLIGPYDPHCGEYTFLAPPLGVWRLAGARAGNRYRTSRPDGVAAVLPPGEFEEDDSPTLILPAGMITEEDAAQSG